VARASVVDVGGPLPGPGPRLAIGVGNTLRRDDGAGPLLVWELERWLRRRSALRRRGLVGRSSPAGQGLDGLRLLVRQQLTPDLAIDLALCSAVLFVDAWQADPGAVPRLQALVCRDPLPGIDGPGLSHGLAPQGVLALAAGLYGVRPQAELLLLPVQDLGHGLGLSAGLRRQLPRARLLLRRWLRGVIPRLGPGLKGHA
jgi:hydrogenase maturation protease